MAERARARRRRTRRRRAVAAAVGVAVIGGGSAAGIAATSDNGPARRLATVGLGSVTQTVESSGTVTSSLKLTPSFPTSGTVHAVDVHVGDTVHKGQTLARLDTTTLQASVDAANSTLASAKQKLEADKTGQTSAGGSGSGSNPSATFASYLTGAPASNGSIANLIKQVEAAQNALIAAQKQVDAGQPAVDAAQKQVDADVAQNVKLRDAQKTACATDRTTSDCGTAMDAYEASADTLSTDMTTLDDAIGKQDGYVKNLDSSITSLDGLVDQLQTAAQQAASNPGGSGPGSGSGGSGGHSGGGSGSGSTGKGGSSKTPSGATPSGPGTGQSGSGRSGTQSGKGQSGAGQSGQSGSGNGQSNVPASAAQLAADQSAIDAAQAQLNVAEQNLSAATLKSPADGKVAAIGLTSGSSSGGKTITIVGTGIPGVSMNVPLAQIDQVKVGQPVTVAADGDSTVLHGTVESIGLLSSTSGSRTTFPVTVRLDAGASQVFDGSGADATITTGSAHDVITVPNSAIRSTAGGTHTVTVMQNGKPTTVRVTLGVAGSDTTQVTSGLKAGQQVVLAELSQPLPGTATSSTGNGGFRFPIGGFGGGGFGKGGGR